ncbi:hypothetical protein CR513_45884, partial [Mucuna pruriens]
LFEVLTKKSQSSQSVNDKVETLSREKEEKPKVASLPDNEGSFGDNLSESSWRSSQSSHGGRCFVGKSLKSWEEWLLHIKFAYNRVVNSTTSHSPFELVYGFNPLSPLDLESFGASLALSFSFLLFVILKQMIKLRIPPFIDNCKLKAYVDWELKVKKILNCQTVVRLMTLDFGEYALVLEDIRSRVIEPCESWKDLKRLMRKRFVPPSYTKNLHNKLQRFYQGSKSVEEYHMEMEMDLMRVQIRESEEATLAWFLHGLNREIQDVVELQHCGTLGKLVHQAIKVEMPIKIRSASRKSFVGASYWKGKDREKERARREKSPKKRSDIYMAEGNPLPPLLLYPL